jgi:hypothetical protein
MPGAHVPEGARLYSSIVWEHGTLNVDGLPLPGTAPVRRSSDFAD